MSNIEQIYIGNTKSFITEKEVFGEQVLIRNEAYYKISNVDTMRPFFMSIVSNSNHWMFISSNGGITAGRKDSNTALFPYYTDDKVTESEDVSGTKTLLRVQKNGKVYLWEPFSTLYKGVYNTSRNLFKNKYGNKVIFEEINHDLDLTYIFEWNSSNLYGFVKKSKLINHSNETTSVTVLDGLQNILPYGVGEDLQKASSNLVDAYKRTELVPESGIGIFALSAIIVDKAEPSEALKSNIVWSTGIAQPTYLLSSLQVSNFRKGFELTQESDIKAEKGAYFVNFKQELKPNEEKQWSIIANVNQSVSDIVALNEKIKSTSNISSLLQDDIDHGTHHLIQLVGAADGIQLTADKLRNSRHFSNTMFNIMRGGIFDDNYTIEKPDFVKYIANANKKVHKKKSVLLNQLPEKFSVNDIKDIQKGYIDYYSDDYPRYWNVLFYNRQTSETRLLTEKKIRIADKFTEFSVYQIGILIEKSNEELAFIHRQFQEFLTADHLSRNDDVKQILFQFSNNLQWEQSIIFFFNHIVNKKLFKNYFETVKAKNKLLAFRIALSNKNCPLDLSKRNSNLYLSSLQSKPAEGR